MTELVATFTKGSRVVKVEWRDGLIAEKHVSARALDEMNAAPGRRIIRP